MPFCRTSRSLGLVMLLMLAAVLQAREARATEAFDVRSVPMMPGATEDFVAGESLLYMSPESVDVTGRKMREILTAAGWHLFDLGHIYEDQTADDYESQDFVKGPHAISVYVTAAPAKQNRTSVQIGQLPVAQPLPVPSDAKRLAYNYREAGLACESAQAAEALFEFYKTELKALGWTRWTPPEANAAAEPGKTIRAHFIKENTNPIKLIIHHEEAGRTIVNIASETHDEMIAAYAPKKGPEPEAKTEPTPAPAAEPEEKEDDDTDAKFAELVQGLVKEAMKPVQKKEAKTEPAESEAAEPLRAMATSVAPVPLPEDATGIEYETGDGTLEFDSASSVKSVAQFYRTEMKARGFKERKSVINSETMVVLNFSKGKKDDLSFTLMRMGNRTDVSARGEFLKSANAEAVTSAPAAPIAGFALPPDGATSGPEPSAPTSEPAQQLALAELQATDQGGLPVPKPFSFSGRTKSKFLYAANANVAASIDTVVAFYRQELGKLGWKEDESAAKIAGDSATLKFTMTDGPAVLTLGRMGSETTISLTVYEKAKAEASGLMPKPGQARIMFGSILETTATVSINGKTFKVKGGETADMKDSPQIEVAPGKHTVEIKAKGQATKREAFEVGADQIWGLLVGPGGGLPLQMY